MKKLFTLLTLALLSIGTAWAGDVFTLDFNGGGKNQSTANYFTITGSTNNSYKTGKYNGTTYSHALKMESSTKITFTNAATSTLRIIQATDKNGSAQTKGLKIDGTSYAYNSSVVTTPSDANNANIRIYTITDLAASSHTIERDGGESGVYRIEVEYTGAVLTQLSSPEISYNAATGAVTIGAVANATKVTYTTDGKTPTASSDTYLESFNVADGTVVKAIAVGDGVSYSNSNVASKTVYLTGFQVAAPVVNQLNGTVAITCATPNATIEYSTDGGSSWTAYSRAFTVTATTDFKARASRENCTTSDVTDATITAVSANVKTRTLVMGYGAFNASGKVMTGKAGDDAEGFTLTMLTDQDKSWSNRNSITISEISNTRTTICGSNGVQVRVDMPAGIKATQLRLYSYVNSATSSTNSAWKEVNGEDLNSTLKTVPMGAFTDVADYDTNPDVRIFPLDNVEGSFTFTNGGIQTCFVLVLDVIEPDVVITPANDMSTYVTANKLDFSKVSPAGLKAYVATNAASGSVTLEEVTTVPAGTPLVLIGTAATDYTVPVAASASAPAKNLLMAGDGTTGFDGTTYDYILYTDGKFYKIGSGSVPVGKAYLHCDSDPTVSAPYLTLDFGGATGIADVRSKMEDVRGDFFDLQGRKVAQPTKGLYIVNGKKVVIK